MRETKEAKQKKHEENKEEVHEEKKEGLLQTLLNNPSIQIYIFIDATYCFGTQIQKLLISDA